MPTSTRPAISLYSGDCIEILRSLPAGSHTHVLTDPPYSRAGGASHTSRTATAGKHSESAATDQFWGFWFAAVWREVARVVRPDGCGFAFCDWRTIGALEKSIGDGWTVSQVAVWDRAGCGLGTPLRASHELIAFVRGPDFRWQGSKTVRNVFRHPWHYGGGKLHPSEKPVPLLAELLAFVNHDPTVAMRVLDPFTGSGSVLAAARSVGVDASGIEIDAETAVGASERLGLRIEVFADGVIREDPSGDWWMMNKESTGWASAARHVRSPTDATLRYRVKLGEHGRDEHGSFVRFTRVAAPDVMDCDAAMGVA